MPPRTITIPAPTKTNPATIDHRGLRKDTGNVAMPTAERMSAKPTRKRTTPPIFMIMFERLKLIHLLTYTIMNINCVICVRKQIVFIYDYLAGNRGIFHVAEE